MQAANQHSTVNSIALISSIYVVNSKTLISVCFWSTLYIIGSHEMLLLLVFSYRRIDAHCSCHFWVSLLPGLNTCQDNMIHVHPSVFDTWAAILTKKVWRHYTLHQSDESCKGTSFSHDVFHIARVSCLGLIALKFLAKIDLPSPDAGWRFSVFFKLFLLHLHVIHNNTCIKESRQRSYTMSRTQ